MKRLLCGLFWWMALWSGMCTALRNTLGSSPELAGLLMDLSIVLAGVVAAIGTAKGALPGTQKVAK
jgi:hypothetical protein